MLLGGCCYGVASVAMVLLGVASCCYVAMVLLGVAMVLLWFYGVAMVLLGGCYGVARWFLCC